MKNCFTLFSFLFLTTAFLSSCRENGPAKTPLFELTPPEQTGVDFINELIEDDSLNVLDFDYMYNGGGVATGDFNNDGLIDLFFTGNKVSCRLYMNKGDMRFEDVTQPAGLLTSQWTEGVTLVDLNNDGLLDIYISTSSGYKKQQNANLLFINNGLSEDSIPSFTEKAAEYGIADSGYNTQAAFFDYDLDGDLDLYVLSNSVVELNRNRLRPRQLKGEGKSTDKLYRNNGDGSFSNVSEEAGILVEGYGLGLAISDINKDGLPDIYAANDFITNDILYINNGDGTFTNRIKDFIKHQSKYGMGTDVADYNNDGWADIVVMDMMPDKNLRQKAMFNNIQYDLFYLSLNMGFESQFIRNTLQLNNGNTPEGGLSFSEIGQMAGVYKTDWSWAPLFADFDNDGLKDLFVSNGYGKDVTDLDFIAYNNSLSQFGTPESKKKKLREEMDKLIEVKIPNFAFKNNGDLTFSDQSEAWGFTKPSLSNGTAYADLDNDGDLDLIMNNVNDPASIYRNNSNPLAKKSKNTARFLKLKILGDSLNSQGLGAKITLKYKNKGRWKNQYFENYLTRGYKSTIDPRIHVGLGSADKVDSLEIFWPDGKYQLIREVKANQVLTLHYKDAKPLKQNEPHRIDLAFEEVSGPEKIKHKHLAQEFVDFKVQPLLPHKHSENGPGMAVGDVDGNGLEDFFIGGSTGYPGQLFYQEKDGSFRSGSLPDSGNFDDMGSLFFDMEGDGDLDLYVVSGGSRFTDGSENYQDRLYLNDGKGNFSRNKVALPEMLNSGSIVSAADYDQDGDLDLFVGGRVRPHQYPLPAKSYILRNEGKRFIDATPEVCPELEKTGMVSAAVWTDFNQDHLIDLILVGEWMPITVLQQKVTPSGTKAFRNITESAGLSKTHGWWNSIIADDFDQDGDMDYVAGNLGLNSRYQASETKPVSLYARDYDNSGSIDPIMFHYIMDGNYPAHPRDALINQINSMRARFPLYNGYGKTSFEGFFADGELDNALALKSYEFRSSYIENLGNGSFALKALPVEAQFAPVSGMISRDFNEDGKADLLLVGNSYSTETNTGRYDASIGNYLQGDGKGTFKNIKTDKSGFYVDGNARAIAELFDHEGASLILVSQFSDSLKTFKHRKKKSSVAFKPEQTDQKAELYLENGQKLLHEFHHGSSYLSHSSRLLLIPDQLDSLVVHSYAGESRIITFPNKPIALP